MDYVSILGGMVLLTGGGELLVRGAIAIARRFGLSPLLIGMTVVSLCTSAPELVVSVRAALAGSPDIAVGNVVGSNIANIALVLGIAALVKPLVVDRNDVRPDALVMLAAVGALGVSGLAGGIGRLAGAAFVAALVAHIALSYRRELKAGTAASDWHVEEVEELEEEIEDIAEAIEEVIEQTDKADDADQAEAARAPGMGVVLASLLLAAGLGGLLLGADLLVGGATAVARALGVPDAVIGLTVVAVGTSLPELATSVVGVVGGHPDVAVGNAVGSCTFNVLAILGITAMVAPVDIAASIARVDIPLMIAVGALAVGALMLKGRMGRVMGGLLAGGYFAYVVALFAIPRA